MKRIDPRHLEETVFLLLMRLATLILVGTLFLIMAVITWKGLHYLDWAMVTQVPQGGFYLGKEGGILNAILGSLVLAGSATLLAVLFALPVALYLNLFAGRKSRLASWCRFSLDVLGGVPSIVFGAFGFLLMVAWGMRASLLGGTITVALMVFPTMARAMDEVLRIVPRELTEAAAALGATPLETALRVSVRQALPGLLTAILIAFGRGIGDAASVLFTAGFTDSLPGSLLRPVATLPLAIFFQLGSPLPEVQGRAYAAALVLTILILIVSLGSRLIGKRLTRHVIR